MSAGAVRAPLIIPLRIPTAELPKSQIDTNTKLEIISETPNTTIYFTINGSRPVVKKNDKDLHNFGTQKFRNPFTLPVGTQTVRALAFLPETGCESNVVTKRFEVSKANCATESGRTTSLDDYAYLDDLKTIEYHRKRTHKAILDLPERDHSIHRSAEKNSDKPNRLDVDSKLSGECYSSKSHEELNAAGDSGQPAAKVDKATSHTDSVTDAPSFRHVLFDSSSQLSRLQQRTDLLHCPNCFNPRSPNQSQKYCVHCGRALPVLPTCAATPLAAIRLGSCPMCHSKVPLNLPVCLICESPLKPPENLARRQQEYRVCAICGTVNPLGTVSCWTCEGRLATGMENLILHSTAEAHHIGPPPSPPATKPKEFTTATDIYLPCPHCRRENNPDARYCDWCGLETASLRVLEPFSNAPHTRPYAGSYDQHRVQFYAEFSLTCSRCGSVNLRHAQFCAFCGFQLPPPDRQSVWSTPTSRMSDATIAAHSAQCWVAPGRNAVVSNASTQTVGLFYPSAADLRRKESCLRSNPFTDAQLHHRTPLLTAVSPGRGFWRKQLDHIIGHLKVYTSNNPDFQAVIGEPRLGKLVAAGLHASHGQATVMLTYTLPHPTSCSPRQSHVTVSKDARPPSCSKSRKLVSSKYCSVSKRCSVPSSGSSTVGTPRTTRNSRGHSPENAKGESQYEPYVARADSPGSEDCTKTSGKLSNDQPLPVTNAVCARPPSGNRTKGSARRQASRRATTQDKAGAATFGHSQLTTADQNLLRLLSQTGEVDQEKIRQTIKEGANPNCSGSDANTPLVVAVHHRKVEAIPPLVEAGAEVNAAGTL